MPERDRVPDRIYQSASIALGLAAMLIALGCSSPPLTLPDGQPMINNSGIVTLVNLHPDPKNGRITAVNYQNEDLIPMCTPVRITSMSGKLMTFEVQDTGRRYEYFYHKAAKEPFAQHLQRVFGTECETSKIARLSPLDQAGIQAGKFYIGMTRDGVYYALGPPPRHKTPDLDAQKWLYWRNKFKKFSVGFGPDGKVRTSRGMRAASIQPPARFQTASADTAPRRNSPWAPGSTTAPAPAPQSAPAPQTYQPAPTPAPRTTPSSPAGGPVGKLYSKRVAVVVGINDYESWPDLAGASNDARRMAQFFRETGFDEVIEIYDRDATRRKLLSVLGNELPSMTDEDALALIYFAGHGQTETLPGGQKRGYIIPVDSGTDDVFASAISMQTLRDLSSRTTARHVYYAIDSCYSGLALTRGVAWKRKGSQTSIYLKKMTSSPAVQLITAGSEGEQAIEIGGQGLFTTYLLRALRGEADADGDGAVTASEIGTFVKPSVSRASSNRQTPQFGTIDGAGEVVFRLP